MSLVGFNKGFTNSKIESRKILNDSVGNLDIDEPGNYNVKISLKSNTKAAINPTSDLTQNPRGVGGQAPQDNGYQPMVPSTKGGSSGDGPTPGYTGNGTGIMQLDGAQGNKSMRGLAY